ncbi:MAG: four-carbon acid sugar kinase family protein, partial [Rhodospirillales bacterium]|nr:four-carbon acid sugar kinase family protein [Rhodospirillales bacterium]
MSGARRIGWYGDDFTGATDTLANLAEAGLRALLFLGLPDAARLAAAGPLDAIGIAGAARAMAPGPMMAELAPVGAFFAAQDVAVLHYKVCSTFDSAPGIGNIATAVATLRPFCPAPWVPILGGQPNLGRYCLFGTLFAAAGAGGAMHRIDRHPTMARHPVTPMSEADLVRHLAAQGLDRVALLDYRAIAADAAAALAALLAERPAAVLMDVAREEDLPVLGRLIWRHAAGARVLAVGASSVARALA